MGLDMYLTGKRYLASYRKLDSALAREIAVLVGSGEHCVKEVCIEAAYWRKANEIHAWFVDNVQDGIDKCDEFDVSREQLAQLKTVCQTVLADHSKAEDLLPTRSGFFFGGTDYEEYYFESLKNTIEKIDQVLALPKEWDFTYQSSW